MWMTAVAMAQVMTGSQAAANVADLEQALTHKFYDVALFEQRPELRGELAALAGAWSTRPEVTERELWLQLSPLVATLNDGHTYLLPPVLEVPRSERDMLDVRVDVRGDTLWLLEVGGEPRAPEQITAIDDWPAPELVTTMRAAFSGEQQAFRDSWTEDIFSSLYPWWTERTGSASVTLASGEVLEVPIGPLPEARLRTATAATSASWSLRREGEVAVLDIDDFQMEGRSWRSFVKGMARELVREPPSALIVDVRGNPGGNSTRLDELFRFTMPSWRVYSAAVLRRPGREGEPWTVSETKAMRARRGARRGRYEGPIVVLADTATFSTAADLVAVYGDFDRAAVVGETPGGMPSCSGNLHAHRLPNSSMRLYVATAYFVRGMPEEGDGPIDVDVACPSPDAMRCALEGLADGSLP